MKVYCVTDTWSIECGDQEYCPKGTPFNGRLIFNCESLNVLPRMSGSVFFLQLQGALVHLAGKVIFKSGYLIIIENTIRFGVVLNNQFRFGNNNYVGNKDIDHSGIQIGDTIEMVGSFTFLREYFSIFTFLPDESSIPELDYEWETSRIFRYSNELNSKPLSEWEQVDAIDTSSQDIEDAYIIEFKLLNDTPKPHSEFSGCHGFVNSICWISDSDWVINCKGKMDDGVKRGHWFYLDKTGANAREFRYEE